MPNIKTNWKIGVNPQKYKCILQINIEYNIILN